MAALGALVILFAVSWAGAHPSGQLVDFPENVRGFSPRIVSGWEAKEGQIPHQISVRMVAFDGLVFGCGATVIHNEWALTAAHCTANRVSFVLRFGGIDLSRPSLILETTEYYNHPLYIEALAGIVQPHDIGLMKFSRFVEYSDLIKPIRMQSSVNQDKDYDGYRLEASGWGRTWTNGPSPQILNWVYLSGVSNSFCRELFGSLIIDSAICASAYNVSSQSTCQGDSGGPLVVKDEDGILTQIGISSFVSRAGCHADLPAGFVRPGHYHDWYYEVTGIDFDWDFSDFVTPTPEVKDSSTTESNTASTAVEEESTSTPTVEEESTSTPTVEEESTSTPTVEEESTSSSTAVENVEEEQAEEEEEEEEEDEDDSSESDEENSSESEEDVLVIEN